MFVLLHSLAMFVVTKYRQRLENASAIYQAVRDLRGRSLGEASRLEHSPVQLPLTKRALDGVASY